MTTLNDLTFDLQLVPTKLFVDLIPQGSDLIINKEFNADGSLPLNALKADTYNLCLTLSASE